MAHRIHIVIDRAEKEIYRRMAEREGKTMSEWLRDAAREKAAAVDRAQTLGTLADLRRFFAECDERESGDEPDWEQHRSVIERSIARGVGS